MQEQIFRDLEILGHKFSKIEKEIGCPKNYLSRFKNPENTIPTKWIKPLLEYISNHSFVKQEAEAPVKTKMVVDDDAEIITIETLLEDRIIKIEEMLKLPSKYLPKLQRDKLEKELNELKFKIKSPQP